MVSDHSRPGVINDLDGISEPGDLNTAIPDFARTWESQGALSVRRPSTLPDPASYHDHIEPEAIFELNEDQKGGSVETILVVPFGCKRCRNLKVACSRMWPACLRCRKAGSTQCHPLQQGYQRLPGPKFPRTSRVAEKPICTRESMSISSPLTLQETTAGRALRAKRVVISASHSPPLKSGASITSGSKRSHSYESDYVPSPKRPLTSAKKPSQKRRGRPPRVSAVGPTEGMDIEKSEATVAGSSMQVASVEDSDKRGSTLKWTFVKSLRGRDNDNQSLRGLDEVHSESIQSNTPGPRVWTKSLDTLLTVFPELGKATVGFSWFQSETPILLLDTDPTRGRWKDSITLSIDLMWDFSCNYFELESSTESFTEDAVRSRVQSTVCLPENGPDLDVPEMDPRRLYPTLRTALYLSGVVSAPPQMCDTHNSLAGEGSRMHNATQDDSVPASTDRSSQLYPYPTSDGSLTPLTPLASFQPCIPLSKPPEVETLLNSQLHFIPLLLWVQRDSVLVPCHLSPEYEYSCMGFFFVSDLHHTVMEVGVPSATGLVQGQVCWSVTLQWAPGGEEALFDEGLSSDMMSDMTSFQTTKDLSHPWWFDPTYALSQVDNNTPFRPRDLRMQYFSYLPLDLLADFHPSESFPRAWFCKLCGLINPQLLFRHQICQSTMCRSVDKGASRGKVDPLSSLRDPHRSSTLVRPTNHIPSVVDSDSTTWDDGMQSWLYAVNGGVTVSHVFTGNQEHLQEDATVLLERIQCEVLLRREDNFSPYFTHTTKLSYQSDDSEATVPTGTPDSVRIAYYSLCDFVHRYGEMEKPRFGEVRMLAWVHSGHKRGAVFRASKSPVVVHCLGAEVVLSFTPKGGYKDVIMGTQDKGKERARNEDRTGSPFAGPSRHLERDDCDQTLIFRSDASESPNLAENADEAAAAMDTMRQRSSFDAGDVAPSHLSTFHPGTKVAHHEVAEPKPEHARKKIKVTKGKSKASVPEISMTLLHGDCVILSGDDFECHIVRTGTTILVIGIPEETR
ncbi:hypothetical protein JVU11DRAFT_12615 [Chiua virens]|nr:hypothetical protein JVU11DRAFT_12615 [Chiua virens]